MKFNDFLDKRAQALPLNTIVIAILVIIVMLVIVVFFTTKVGDSGSQIDDTSESVTTCSDSNPIIAPLLKDNEKTENKACKDNVGRSVVGIKDCCIIPK